MGSILRETVDGETIKGKGCGSIKNNASVLGVSISWKTVHKFYLLHKGNMVLVGVRGENHELYFFCRKNCFVEGIGYRGLLHWQIKKIDPQDSQRLELDSLWCIIVYISVNVCIGRLCATSSLP